MAGARKVVIDDCGHVPQEEKPEVVLKLLRDFLAEPAAAGGPDGAAPPASPSASTR